MATFASVTFKERAVESASFARFGREAIMTYLQPGSRLLKQTTGAKRDRLSLPIQCTGAQLSSLLGVVDTIGTLAWSGGTRTASLDAINGPAEYRDSDVCTAVLEFTGF